MTTSNTIQPVRAEDIKIALSKKHGKDFFLTEVKSGSSWFTQVGDMKILDALAIRKSWTNPCFTGYEVKISRGDFLRDAKFYTYEELCNCLYIVCPKGMIDRTEVPESVGLMYYDPQSRGLQTKKKAIFRKIDYSPDLLRYIIYSRLDSDRYPFFSDKREYFDAYLQGKIDNRILGSTVKSKLVEENARLEKELAEVANFQKQMEAFNAIKAVLQKHGIYGWRDGSIAEELDRALTFKCPEGLSLAKEYLTMALQQVERAERQTKET